MFLENSTEIRHAAAERRAESGYVRYASRVPAAVRNANETPLAPQLATQLAIDWRREAICEGPEDKYDN